MCYDKNEPESYPKLNLGWGTSMTGERVKKYQLNFFGYSLIL